MKQLKVRLHAFGTIFKKTITLSSTKNLPNEIIFPTNEGNLIEGYKHYKLYLRFEKTSLFTTRKPKLRIYQLKRIGSSYN